MKPGLETIPQVQLTSLRRLNWNQVDSQTRTVDFFRQGILNVAHVSLKTIHALCMSVSWVQWKMPVFYPWIQEMRFRGTQTSSETSIEKWSSSWLSKMNLEAVS